MLVLLVHDDQSQRVHRGEDGRAGADGDAGAALADFVPLIVALAGGQMAVQHRHQGLERAGAEAGLETLDRLGREGDFGHQDDRPFALLESVSDGLEVHLGLAAAGDTVQKKST